MNKLLVKLCYNSWSCIKPHDTIVHCRLELSFSPSSIIDTRAQARIGPGLVTPLPPRAIHELWGTSNCINTEFIWYCTTWLTNCSMYQIAQAVYIVTTVVINSRSVNYKAKLTLLYWFEKLQKQQADCEIGTASGPSNVRSKWSGVDRLKWRF